MIFIKKCEDWQNFKGIMTVKPVWLHYDLFPLMFDISRIKVFDCKGLKVILSTRQVLKRTT